MTETVEYKEWLSSGTSNVALIDAIIIEHPNWAETIYLCNWDRDIEGRYETSPGVWATQTFSAARFLLTATSLEDSLAQRTTLAITAADGLIYDELNMMTADDRDIPIKLRSIQYRDNDLLNPTISYPYPVWTIGSVSCDYEIAACELSVPQLRVRRIGRYFNRLELPILSYL